MESYSNPTRVPFVHSTFSSTWWCPGVVRGIEIRMVLRSLALRRLLKSGSWSLCSHLGTPRRQEASIMRNWSDYFSALCLYELHHGNLREMVDHKQGCSISFLKSGSRDGVLTHSPINPVGIDCDGEISVGWGLLTRLQVIQVWQKSSTVGIRETTSIFCLEHLASSFCPHG